MDATKIINMSMLRSMDRAATKGKQRHRAISCCPIRNRSCLRKAAVHPAVLIFSLSHGYKRRESTTNPDGKRFLIILFTTSFLTSKTNNDNKFCSL